MPVFRADYCNTAAWLCLLLRGLRYTCMHGDKVPICTEYCWDFCCSVSAELRAVYKGYSSADKREIHDRQSQLFPDFLLLLSELFSSLFSGLILFLFLIYFLNTINIYQSHSVTSPPSTNPPGHPSPGAPMLGPHSRSYS